MPRACLCRLLLDTCRTVHFMELYVHCDTLLGTLETHPQDFREWSAKSRVVHPTAALLVLTPTLIV
jgi:hypothetical protein